MPYIRFVAEYTVKDEEGATYREGDVVECSDAGAEHFTRRHVAVLCDAPKPASSEKVETDEGAEKPARKPRAKRTVKKDASTD